MCLISDGLSVSPIIPVVCGSSLTGLSVYSVNSDELSFIFLWLVVCCFLSDWVVCLFSQLWWVVFYLPLTICLLSPIWPFCLPVLSTLTKLVFFRPLTGCLCLLSDRLSYIVRHLECYFSQVFINVWALNWHLKPLQIHIKVKLYIFEIWQVRDHFNAFIAEHPNGKMKMKDFREMMSKVYWGPIAALVMQLEHKDSSTCLDSCYIGFPVNVHC